MLQPSFEHCFLRISKGVQSSWRLEPDVSIFNDKLVTTIFRVYAKRADIRLVKGDYEVLCFMVFK